LDLQIQAKNVRLSDGAREYILKKHRRLERHLKGLSEARLELTGIASRAKDERVTAQMTLSTGRHVLRGQEHGPDVYSAIDSVADVMDRQIERYKGKVYRSEQPRESVRAGAAPDEESPDGGERPPAFDEARVVRTKRFAVTPMDSQEAIDRMELLSHSFFLFYNVETEEYNVLYRRRDGDYGIIEAELTGE
jgi:putative sigma-54 modulation protein